jgi:hypothetical protein
LSKRSQRFLFAARQALDFTLIQPGFFPDRYGCSTSLKPHPQGPCFRLPRVALRDRGNHSISAFAVARDERQGMMRLIERGAPISFGETKVLGEGAIEQGLIALLPPRETGITSDTVAELELVFDPDGEIG